MSSNQSLVDRTEAVYRKLRSMRRRFRFGAWITLIIGGLLIVLVATYFTIGYREISSFRDPELIVSLVGDMVEQQIPAMRQTAEDQVKANAPVWAEQASEQVLAAIPPLADQLESLALQKADEAIAKIDTIGEQKFRQILNENRDTVQNAINQLKNDEEISEGVVLALQEAIEREFQIEADSQAAALVTIVSDMNANMEELFVGENLSREQRAERRVLMLARRLHIDRLGGMTLEDISESIPAVKDLIRDREERQLKMIQAEQTQAASEQRVEVATASAEDVVQVEEKEEAPAETPDEPAEPAETPEEEKNAPVDKPEEKADEPEEKEAAPAETAKPSEKTEEEAKPAESMEEKKEAPAEEKPAAEPKEEAKPADKAEGAPAEADQPAEKPAEKE